MRANGTQSAPGNEEHTLLSYTTGPAYLQHMNSPRLSHLSGTQRHLGVLHLTELRELVQDHHHVVRQHRVPPTQLILPITTHAAVKSEAKQDCKHIMQTNESITER